MVGSEPEPSLGALLPGTVPGGSNIGWYYSDPDGNPAGSGYSSILADYHLRAKDHVRLGRIDPHAVIEEQFRQMANRGQRRARLLIWHMRGGDDASLVVNSETGDLAPQLRENLLGILTSLRDKGFKEVQIALGSQGYNLPIACNWKGDRAAESWCTIGDPSEDIWSGPAALWNSANDSYFEENWRFLASIVRATDEIEDLDLLFDLQNELAPVMNGNANPLSDETWGRTSAYVLRTWTRFVQTFGRDRTVGFSVPGTWAPRIRALYSLYDQSGVGRPRYLDVHIYHVRETHGPSADDAYWMFREAHDTLNSVGERSTPIIIGEAHYNDEPTARRLAQAQTETGRSIAWLAQWPWAGLASYDSAAGNCQPGVPPHQVLGATPSFCQYARYGFGGGEIDCTMQVSSNRLLVGQTVTFAIESTPAGLMASWEGSHNGTVDVAADPAGMTPFVHSGTQPDGTGSFTRYATLRNSEGDIVCTTNTIDVQVDKATCSVSAPQQIEVGELVTFAIDSDPPGLNAYWFGTYEGVEDVTADLAGPTPYVLTGPQPDPPGTFQRWVELRNANNDLLCTTDPLTIVVSP